MAIQLIECTPCFSEGRRHDVIDAILNPFRTTPGCHLLDHRSDGEENHLTISLAGRLGPVQEALMAAARIALETIDMNAYTGLHLGIGAVDMIPFAPVTNISMEACTTLARDFGRRLFHETEIPVYFFGEAAIRHERRCPADLRRGGYDLLKIEASAPKRRPDIGEPRLHPTAGATAVGVGKRPLYFHVNLRTADIAVAVKIAEAVTVHAGGPCHVKANARAIEDRDMTQIRFTILDPAVVPLYRILEMVRMEARGWGVEVALTDIPGMVSAGAFIQSAAYYLQAAGFHLDQVTELRLLAAMGDDT